MPGRRDTSIDRAERLRQAEQKIAELTAKLDRLAVQLEEILKRVRRLY